MTTLSQLMNAQQLIGGLWARGPSPEEAKILELAATLDRIDRAGGNVDQQPQMQLLRRGFQILSGTANERAEQVQLLFSREY